MKTRIVLAEDHAVLRQKIKEILSSEPEFEVVAETASGPEAVTQALRHRPDVAIISSDARTNGMETVTRILSLLPKTIVIILSMNDDERYVSRARRAGARGYVLKNQAADTLIGAVRRARLSTAPAGSVA